MKKTLSALIGLLSVGCFVPQNSHAYLPVSAASSVDIVLYGMYTTADASCQTGWSAVLPFNKNAPAQNFASAGGIALGMGSISNPTNCILMIIKNSGVFTIASGNYTTTSNGAADSVCNAGVNGSTNIFYGNSNAWQVTQGVTWPASTEAPTQDMVAAGATQITTFSGSETGNEIVPVYVSVNSACTGSSANDPAGCSAVDAAGQVTGTKPPTSAGDINHGYRTTAPAANQSRYKFVINMANALGNSGGSCAFASAPVMQFVAF